MEHAEIDQLKREVTQLRRSQQTLWGGIALLLIGMPLVASGFETFTPLKKGALIEAAEFNQRFDGIAAALTSLEDRTTTVETTIDEFVEGRALVGSGGALLNELGNWISSVSRTSEGSYTLQLDWSASDSPLCVAAVGTPSFGRGVTVTIEDAKTVNVRTSNTSTGAALDGAFVLHCVAVR